MDLGYSVTPVCQYFLTRIYPALTYSTSTIVHDETPGCASCVPLTQNLVVYTAADWIDWLNVELFDRFLVSHGLIRHEHQPKR